MKITLVQPSMWGKKIDRDSFLKSRSMDCAIVTHIFLPWEPVKLQSAFNKNYFLYRFYREMNPISLLNRLKNIDSRDDFNYYIKKLHALFIYGRRELI